MASESVVGNGRSPDPGVRERGPGLMRRAAYLLLVGECLVILIPSIYARLTPKLFGFPFFYWFQLLWILVAMVVTGIVYLLTTVRIGGHGASVDADRQAAEDRGDAP